MTAQQLAYAALGVFIFFIFVLPLAEKLFKKFRGWEMTTNNTANKIKELQERLDCINELLTSAFNYGQPCEDGLDAAIAEYDVQSVNQAHRVASGEELPKRFKE